MKLDSTWKYLKGLEYQNKCVVRHGRDDETCHMWGRHNKYPHYSIDRRPLPKIERSKHVGAEGKRETNGYMDD